MFEVRLSAEARLFFEEADASLQRRFDRAFQVLARNPHRHNNIKPLKGKFAGCSGIALAIGASCLSWTTRTGAWVHDIAHRSEMYE